MQINIQIKVKCICNTFKDKDVDTARTELLADRQHHDVITFNFHPLIYKGPNMVSRGPCGLCRS